MDGVTLLREAKAAGLTVTMNGDKLVIRGPKAAEAVALRLLKNKPVVMAALRRGGDHADHDPGPTPTCPWRWQGKTPHRRFWLSVFGVVVCGHCSPPASPSHVLKWIEPKEN